MNVQQTTSFIRQTKKLHKNQKKELDEAIREIMKDPSIGEMKKGDLNGVQVYKFKMINQLTLLAYDFNAYKQELILLALGSHENFYRDLKK
jgi:mRNA-degrading endonuclease YafQ of YafQ-DinJ toxin-antitoxin module